MRRILTTISLLGLLGSSSVLAAFREEPATVVTHDGFQLAGKVSYPSNACGKRSGVVLIHGSGAGTMDQWIPGQLTADGKPARLFLPVADALNEAGAVVLRYNKRGVKVADDGSAQSVPDQAGTRSLKNFVQDVLAAVQVLRRDPAVDPDRIILLGLSEGTVVGPLAAAQDGRIAGLIQLSSQGSNLRDLLFHQYVERTMMSAAQIVDSNHDSQLSQGEINAVPGFHLPIALVDRDGDGLASLQELRVELVQQFRATLANLQSDTWYQEYVALDDIPQRVAAFKGPILLLHGKIDMQTPLSELFLIQDALRGRNNITVKTYDGLGHGFSPHLGVGGMIPTVGPMDVRVPMDIRDWFQQTFSGPEQGCRELKR